MSKSKTNQKLADHLGKLLTSVQDRAFWLSDQFRKLADKVDVLAQKQRNDTAVLQQVQVFAKSELASFAAAHNRLRAEFDSLAVRFPPGGYHAAQSNDVQALRENFNLLKDANSAQIAELRKLFSILKDEVDRLRTLSVSRVDSAREHPFHSGDSGWMGKLSFSLCGVATPDPPHTYHSYRGPRA